METTATVLDSGRIRLEKEGRSFLGFKISATDRPDAATVRREQPVQKGYIFRRGTVEEWLPAGYHQYQGRYIIGPWLEGIPLALIGNSRTDELRAFLPVLAGAVDSLKRSGVAIDQLDAFSVLRLSDGGVFILHPDLSTRQRLCLDAEEYRCGFTELNHPLLRGEQNLAFSFSVLAYRALTGSHPFDDQDARPSPELLRERMREGLFIPVHYQNPLLDASAAACINESLKKEGYSESFSAWIDCWNDLAGTSGQAAVPPEEQQKRKTAALKMSRRIQRKLGVTGFLRRRRGILIGSGILLILALIFAGNLIRRVTEPPLTRGMSEREVVQLFYRSMNSLDHMTMEKCVVGDAGKEYIDEAVYWNVILRMRQGYEGKPVPFLSAEEWIRDGRKPLEQGTILLGVGNLKIETAGSDRFRVELEKWASVPGEADEGEPKFRYSGVERRDTVTLMEKRGAYRIQSIQKTESRALGQPRLLTKE